MPYTDLVKKAYTDQKNLAKGRGIQFLLSFEDWLKIWKDSGHLHERGRKPGQYCMSRFEDSGPYSLTNVEITLVERNNQDAAINHRGDRNSKSKLTLEIAKEIRARHIEGSRGRNSTASLAREYGVHPNTIRDLIKGNSWNY